MASLDDLKGILKSVNSSTMMQVNTIKDVLKIQKRTGAGAENVINNSNLIPDMTSSNDSFDTLITLGREQVKFLEDIFNIQNQINEREKEALRVSKQPKTDTSTAADKAEKPADTKVKDKKEPVANDLFAELLGIPTGILAAAAALGLAFAGLRGWEVTAIKYVKNALGGIGDSIVNGVKNIKTSILTAFGLDVDGKPLPNSVLDSITKNPIIQKLTNGLSKILTPFKMMGDYITGLFSGGGGDAKTSKAVKFLGEIGENIGTFAKTVGKILKPIGILFSAFDGVTAFMNTEGDIFDKLSAGIGAFLGDFIGAPLDLLKSVVAWGMSKLGFENAAEGLESFSFETLIGDIVNSIYGMVRGAVEWVGTLFSDPVEALTQLWNSYYGEGGIADLLFTPVSMAIDWITKKFGWREEDAPPFNLRDFIANTLTSIYDTIKTKFDALSETLSTGFGTFVDYLSSIPDRIKFSAEEMFIDVAAKLVKGFISFGDWLASIPARLKLMALQTIQSVPGGSWLVSDETIAETQKAVNERSSGTQEKNDEIDKLAEEKRIDLAKRKAESGIYNIEPTAFKTPSRADVFKSAASATAESAAIMEKSYAEVMQEEQNKASSWMNKAEVIAETTKEQTTSNVNYAPITDARSNVYNGGSSTTNIYGSSSSKSDLNYGIPYGVQ